MVVPQYDEMLNPLFKAIKELGGSASIAQMEFKTAEVLGLSERDIREVHKGKRTKFSYRLAWTRNYLKNYGVIETSSRGIWSLTPKGKNLSSLNKDDVNSYVKGLTVVSKRSLNFEPLNIQEFLRDLDLTPFGEHKFHFLKNPGNRVDDIIKCVEKRWVLPDFQRYYDWDKEDVRSFLEAIFNDYFVGSILLWEVENEPEVAVFPISGVKQKIEKPESIILDGQQRVTSLYYSIKAPEMENDSLNCYFYINFRNFFENSSKDIVLVINKKLSTQESVRLFLFPIYELENAINWFREFEDNYESESLDRRKFKELQRIMQDRVNHMIQGFQIPDVRLPASMKLHHVVDIFENINTKGKLLDAFDLLIAASSKHKIYLRDLWETSCDTYPNLTRYYNKTEKLRMYIIQAVSLLYNPTGSCKKSDILEIYEQIYKQERGMNPKIFEKHWEEMSSYVDMAIDKIEDLKDGFGVINENYVPYMPTIPILAALLKEVEGRENKHDCNKKIKQWYWSVIFNEAYSSAVDSQLTSDFQELKKWFSNDEEIPSNVKEARRVIQNLKIRKASILSSAMYKGVLSLLALKGSRDLKTGEMVNSRSDYHKDHIFPKSKKIEFKAGKDIDSILNMALLTSNTNEVKKAKDPEEYFKELARYFKGDKEEYLTVLDTHYINKEGFAFLLKNDFENFISVREKLLLKEIKKQIGWTEKDEKIQEENELDIRELIESGEDEHLEFKATFKKICLRENRMKISNFQF